MTQDKRSVEGAGGSMGLSDAERRAVRGLVDSWFQPALSSRYQRRTAHAREAASLPLQGAFGLTSKGADRSTCPRRKRLALIATDVDIWIFTLMIVAAGVMGLP